MRLTLNDLYALKKATNLMRGRNPIHLNIDELPELKKRWNNIYIYLSKDNMGCIAQTRCMMFGDDMRFNSFVSRLDDMIEEKERERKAQNLQMKAHWAAYVSACQRLVRSCYLAHWVEYLHCIRLKQPQERYGCENQTCR